MTRVLRLNSEVVACMEEALRLMHEYVPGLREATLPDLTEGHIALRSGLPGAFASLVAAVHAQGRIGHAHQYNTVAQHRNAPAMRVAAMATLRKYSYDRARNHVSGPF